MEYTYEKLTEISFKIITFAGEAKSEAMLGLYAAKKQDFITAEKKLKIAHENLILAEKQHAELIQKEAQGVEIKIPLILMHSEDQLLSTETLILMVEEIIELYKKINKGLEC